MGTLRRLCAAIWQLCGMQGICAREMEVRTLGAESGKIYQPSRFFRGSLDEHSANVGYANMPMEYPEETE